MPDADGRSMRVAWLLVLLAGCASLPAPVPASGPAWTDVEPDWWVATSFGCGFCDERPDFYGRAYADSGHFIALEYTRGEGPATVTFAAGVDPGLHAAIRHLLLAHDAYGRTSGGTDVPRPLHVLEASTMLLSVADRADVNGVIADGLDAARSTRGAIEATDCGPDRIESFDPPRRAQDGCGMDAGDGWRLVRSQLVALAPQ